MGTYTTIDLKQVQDILNLYGIHEVKNHTPLSLGISNSNYKIETKDHFFLLKISNDKDFQALQEEQKILLYLNQLGFPYSLTPIQTLSQENVYRYGAYHGVLFPYIEGVPPQINGTTCYEIGRGLALLHRFSHNKEIKDLRVYSSLGYDVRSIFNYVEKSATCPLDFKDTFFQIFPQGPKTYLNSLTQLPQGVIHGDLYYDNTLFNNGRLQTLLDFEQSGISEFLLDIGISLSGTCLKNGHIEKGLIQSYLRGYQSERRLIDLEAELINEAIILGLFSISLWRIRRFTEGKLDPNRKESYKELLKRALHFHEHLALV